MATKIAINGFGRIGRCIVRALVERGITDVEIVAINDLTDAKTLAHLLKYDSIHREFKAGGAITHDEKSITVGGKRIEVLALKNPAELPWKALGVDIVLECTGLFTDKDKAAAHITAGAKKVLISAPAKGAGPHRGHRRQRRPLRSREAPRHLQRVVHHQLPRAAGQGHARQLRHRPRPHDDGALVHQRSAPPRRAAPQGRSARARAAAVSMIPSSTGAAKALSEVIPALKGKFDGTAVRVPTVDVSLVDLTIETEKSVTKEAIHAAMKKASESGPMATILDYTDEELVSSDYIGNQASSTFDATMTLVLGDKFAKVFGWYDNEMGFSHRMVDLAVLVAKKGV